MRLRLFISLLSIAPVAVMTGCAATGGYNLPPASRLMEPGPGVGGPGPGVLSMPSPDVAPASYTPASYAVGAGAGPACSVELASAGMEAQKVQLLFARPDAMQIAFDASGSGAFDSIPLVTPARQNFYEGGIYRLKLSAIPGREGTELYPTLEIGRRSARTAAYLAHNAIPIQFTEEDFDQVMTGNFVTKVIYLPDPEFQELALAGVETLVSTRLDPGLDPISEAARRGAILAIVRLGNKDMEVPESEVVVGSSVAPEPGGVVSADYVSQASCNGQCETGCQSCVGGGAACGCGIGGCLGGCKPGPESFYGPHSTPRGGHGPGGLPAALAGGGTYGMPITGTPIGLPGPPHVPLGVPAGLKKHVMHNWTHRHIPDPVQTLKINVKQRPGLSYPQPPNRAWVVENTIHSQPHFSRRHFGIVPSGGLPLDGGVQSASAGGACPDGTCPPGAGGLLHGLRHKLGL